MKRQRKRSRAFYATMLSTILAVALIAPAATAFGVEEGTDETDGEPIEEQADECVLHVDLEGEKLRKDRYQRPGLKYKKQVKTYRTEYTYDKEKWVPGAKQYKYAKEKKTREWVEGQDEILEYRFRTRAKLHGSKEVKEILGWNFGGGGTTSINGTQVPGHWFASAGWHQIPDVVTNIVWGPSGVPESVLGTGTVNLNVYGGPNQTVQYNAHEVQTDAGHTDWSEWSEWSEENPGEGSDLKEVESQQKSAAVEQGWGHWSDWAPYGHDTEWFDGKRTWLYEPGGPWKVGVAKFLGHDRSKMYRYVESDTQWKPGTNQYVPFKQDLGPSTTEPSTTPFWIRGTKYRYTNIQEREVFDGWKWFQLDGDYMHSDWLKLGQKIDTQLGFTVWPGQQFKHGDTWYRYRLQPVDLRSSVKWVVEEVAGGGTNPPPGDDWEKTASWVIDHEPNEVRVTIGGDVVVEETFGESYTESFLLDHGDTYLVEYKPHGDEDWSVDQEGVADCIQPDDLVTFSEWEEGELECDSENVSLARTKTTTPFTWDPETRTWVEDEENSVEEGEEGTRELTTEEEQWQESEDCIEILDTVEEKDDEPEVEEVAVKKTVETQVLGTTETLPTTGASVLALLVTALLAMFAGGSALRIRSRSER